MPDIDNPLVLVGLFIVGAVIKAHVLIFFVIWMIDRN